MTLIVAKYVLKCWVNIHRVELDFDSLVLGHALKFLRVAAERVLKDRNDLSIASALTPLIDFDIPMQC